MSIGPLAATGEVVTDGHKDGKNHRPLLWMIQRIWFETDDPRINIKYFMGKAKGPTSNASRVNS